MPTLYGHKYPYYVSSSVVDSGDIAVNEQMWTLPLGSSQISKEARQTDNGNLAG